MPSSSRQPLNLLSVFTALLTLFLLGAVSSAQLFQFGESARKARCQNNLRQLGLALLNYDAARSALPGYRVSRVSLADEKTYVRPLIYEIYPQLERVDLYEQSSREAYAQDGAKDSYHEFLICPSAEKLDEKARKGSPTHYIFNTGMPDVKSKKGPPDWPSNGVFQDNKSRDTGYINSKDGASNTLLMSERAELGRWTAMAENEISFVWSPRFKSEPWAKINGVAAKAKKDGGKSKEADKPAADEKSSEKKTAPEESWVLARPSSKHGKTVNVAFCDVHVRPLRETIDYVVYAQLMTPHGAQAKYAGTEDDVEKEFRDYLLDEKDFD